MEFLRANAPSDVTTFIEASPETDAWFVKDLRNGMGSLPADPREQLESWLWLIRYALFDLDGTLHRGIQWRSYEAWIQRLAEDPWSRDPKLARRLLDAVLAINHWYGGRRSRNPTNHRDQYTESWDLSKNDAIEAAWVAVPIMAMAALGATKETLAQIVRNFTPREGMKDLLTCPSLKRRVVVTFGIQDTAEIFFRLHGIEPGETLRVEGSQLQWDSEHLAGVHPNILVSSKKSVAAKAHLDDVYPKVYEILALGDTIFDLGMAPVGALRIFLMPPDHDGSDHTKAFRNLTEMWDGVDVILRSNSLKPLSDLLRQAHPT